MKITLVRPNMGLSGGMPYADQGRMEPLTLAALAGLVPDGIEVKCFDDRIEDIPYDEKTDLVGITVETYMARRAYEIAGEYRKRGIPVVLGGYHPTLLPDEALEHGDAVVVGEAEGVFENLIADFQAGGMQRLYSSDGRVNLAGQKNRWQVHAGKSYLPVALTQFGRGCTNQCNFCATGTIFKQRHHWKPVEETIAELRERAWPFVFFVDDNIVGHHAAAKELFAALIPLGIKWIGQASLDFARDDELLDLMVRSGCQGLVVGFESILPENLAQMQKNCNDRDQYDTALKKIRDKGLMLWAAFLVGYDGDTRENVRATVDWALSKRFAFAAYNILTPYPGTPLYDRMRNEGRLLYDKWWTDPRYRFGDCVFQPQNMKPEELAQAALDARLRFNSLPNILWRATDFKTNAKNLWSLTTYLRYSPLFRQEMLRKVKMQLGYSRG